MKNQSPVQVKTFTDFLIMLSHIDETKPAIVTLVSNATILLRSWEYLKGGEVISGITINNEHCAIAVSSIMYIIQGSTLQTLNSSENLQGEHTYSQNMENLLTYRSKPVNSPVNDSVNALEPSDRPILTLE